MYTRLVNHNPDIERLVKKGYAVSFDSSYLIIRDIPYVDGDKKLQWGAIVSKMIFVDENHVKIENHVVFFCGSHPCELDGNPIKNLGGGATTLTLKSPDLVVQRTFSNKPAGGFGDFFDKIESYVTIISGPASELFGVSPLTFRSVDINEESVFKFNDTLTSRAEIGDLALNFSSDVIAIIGLGGTGSYLLDFIVKTPVKEVRGFDLDHFYIHNAFRSPGRLIKEELGKTKAEVYRQRYENFRYGLKVHSKFIIADSVEDLEGVTFAFVCVDKGSSRTEIFNALIRLQIPFIDMGMGLDRKNGPINGMLRATYYSVESAKNVLDQSLAPMHDEPDDIYKNNIQISELNALNACLAVIKYKQTRGFYEDENHYYHILYGIGDFNAAGVND